MRRAAAFLARLRWPEWPVLVGLVGVFGALWLFIVLASEVAEGETHGFDRRILLALRTPGNPADPIGPPWVEEMMRDFSGLGSTAVLTILTAAVVFYLLLAAKRRAALVVFLSIGSGQLLSTALKLFFERARPDLVPHATIVYTSSFPSGHSTMSAVVYLTLGALLARVEGRRRVRVYLVALGAVLTLLVGASRVYLGVHWPTDVLGGWTIGAAWALLWWLVTFWLQRSGKVEREPGSS
jgi:undecaprenyl-diphosphatase